MLDSCILLLSIGYPHEVQIHSIPHLRGYGLHANCKLNPRPSDVKEENPVLLILMRLQCPCALPGTLTYSTLLIRVLTWLPPCRMHGTVALQKELNDYGHRDWTIFWEHSAWHTRAGTGTLCRYGQKAGAWSWRILKTSNKIDKNLPCFALSFCHAATAGNGLLLHGGRSDLFLVYVQNGYYISASDWHVSIPHPLLSTVDATTVSLVPTLGSATHCGFRTEFQVALNGSSSL